MIPYQFVVGSRRVRVNRNKTDISVISPTQVVFVENLTVTEHIDGKNDRKKAEGHIPDELV